MVNWIDHIEGTVEGTPVNRKNLMDMQGFGYVKTTFNEDGSITETNDSGEETVTTFNDDGSITTRFTGINGMTIAKTTIFNDDGSVSEEVTE